jgi:hypothetical protein
MSKKKKWILKYSNIPSAIRQVPHGGDLPISVSPKSCNTNDLIEEEEKASGLVPLTSNDPDVAQPISTK